MRRSSTPITVIKGRSAGDVDRQKVINALLKACGRAQYIRRYGGVGRRYRRSEQFFQQEVRSEQVGEMIMERLKNLDEVAYVEFASVYESSKISTHSWRN